MKISWFFLLVVLVLSSWLDVKTSSGSINVAGSASIQGPSVPSSSDGSVPVTGPSITGGGSVSIKCPSSPSVSDDSVCVEGGSTATSNSGSVTFNVGESTSMQLSSSSSSGPPVARGTGSDILFDNFDDSAAIDSFTGRPVSQDLQEAFQQSAVASLDSDAPTGSPMVGFTLMQGAAGKGAFCLDGSLPGYHFDKGSGSGETSWLVNLEGGGWCTNIKSCVFRKNSRHGSSDRMQKSILFTGILSKNANENPDFYNWNRVRIRYCDGASFKGEGENMEPHLFFRGQRIWLAAMDELMALGMNNATQALLSGCSAGGLSTIHHCDEFRELFPVETKVKCLSDAGFFVDAASVSGKRILRTLYNGVVSLQGVGANLPRSCTSIMDPSLCFFPQYIINDIKTPLFLVNTAYDAWQIQDSLAPKSADRHRFWLSCILNIANCNATQLEFLHGFRLETLDDLFVFSTNKQNGLFINSCFAHCQTDKPNMWHGDTAPRVGNKTIAEAVGDWYFDRTSPVKLIDCPYPCNPTCHNLVFDRTISV